MERIGTITGRTLRKLVVAGVLGPLALAGLAGSAHAITYYNLTHQNPDGSPNASFDTATISGAIFSTPDNGTVVGTGVLQPFVRIQPPHNVNCGGGHPCTEAGYNTDGGVTPNPGPGHPNKPQFETKDNEGTNWNHSLRLADVGTVMVGGVLYREFILDINEAVAGPKNDEYLSLDKFKLYQAAVGTLDNFNAPDHGGTGPDTADNYFFNPAPNVVATKIYDIDQGTTPPPNSTNTDDNPADSTIGLNYFLNSGSGKGIDMVARVPDALFDKSKEFVYLYSSFGELGINAATGGGNKPAAALPPGDFGQTAGFEEWSTRVEKKVPEPASLLLLCLGLGLLTLTRTVRRSGAPLQA